MDKGTQRKEASKLRQQEINQKVESDLRSAKYDNEPLKQYIRRYGWVKIIKIYQDRMQQSGINRNLKILTLPGKNASDIGLFFREGIAFVNSNQVFNIAICDEENASTVQANLAHLGRFLALSSGELSKTLTSDYKFSRLFPFDVINLDFCDQLFGLSKDNNLTALETIFHLQSGQSFLLLITNRCISIQDRQRKQAESVMFTNLSIEAFRQAYIRKYGSDNMNLCMGDHVSLTQMIYPKVIARLARDYGYRIIEQFAAHYGRSNEYETYNMVCHSFEMIPLDRKSESLRYKPNKKRTNSTAGRVIYEFPESTRMLANQEYNKFVTNIVGRDTIDIESKINGDKQLKKELENEALSLMNWWESRT